MSMINKEVSDFSVQAYQNGEFKTVTKATQPIGGTARMCPQASGSRFCA